jgi:hypothetical protein
VTVVFSRYIDRHPTGGCLEHARALPRARLVTNEGLRSTSPLDSKDPLRFAHPRSMAAVCGFRI